MCAHCTPLRFHRLSNTGLCCVCLEEQHLCCLCKCIWMWHSCFWSKQCVHVSVCGMCPVMEGSCPKAASRGDICLLVVSHLSIQEALRHHSCLHKSLINSVLGEASSRNPWPWIIQSDCSSSFTPIWMQHSRNVLSPFTNVKTKSAPLHRLWCSRAELRRPKGLNQG